MFETRIDAPVGLVVSLSDAKEAVRVEHTAEDTLIERLIVRAQAAVEEMTGRALLTQTWRQDLVAHRMEPVRLRRTPVQSVDFVEYFDAENAEQSATVEDFMLYGADAQWFLRPGSGAAWPTLYARPDALRITYTTGYGDTGADVPEPLHQAILLLVAHYYQSREAATARPLSNLPFGVEALTGLYRSGWVSA